MHIVKTYLKVNSPVQLNLSSTLSNLIPEWELILQDKKPADHNLFNDLQLHCLLDITDVFERLKASDREVREIIASWTTNPGPIHTN